MFYLVYRLNCNILINKTWIFINIVLIQMQCLKKFYIQNYFIFLPHQANNKIINFYISITLVYINNLYNLFKDLYKQ